MIHTTKLKQFIHHPDDRVRREVMKYFHNARIIDNEVMQLSIQACKKYGWEECIYLVYENNHQTGGRLSSVPLRNHTPYSKCSAN